MSIWQTQSKRASGPIHPDRFLFVRLHDREDPVESGNRKCPENLIAARSKRNLGALEARAAQQRDQIPQRFRIEDNEGVEIQNDLLRPPLQLCVDGGFDRGIVPGR